MDPTATNLDNNIYTAENIFRVKYKSKRLYFTKSRTWTIQSYLGYGAR